MCVEQLSLLEKVLPNRGAGGIWTQLVTFNQLNVCLPSVQFPNNSSFGGGEITWVYFRRLALTAWLGGVQSNQRGGSKQQHPPNTGDTWVTDVDSSLRSIKGGSDSSLSEPQPARSGRAFLFRVLRVALPLQLLLLLLIGLACLVPMSEEDYSCALSNNFARSFHPMLRYTNGPPPLWTKQMLSAACCWSPKEEFGPGQSQTSKERTRVLADALGTAAVAHLRIPCVQITASEVMVKGDGGEHIEDRSWEEILIEPQH